MLPSQIDCSTNGEAWNKTQEALSPGTDGSAMLAL